MTITGLGTSKDKKFSSTVLWTVLLLLVFSGCRTYGGYGSEEANFEQIQQANLSFTEAFSARESEVERLRQAAADHEELQPHLERYEEALHMHEGMLVEHRGFGEQAEANRGDHRRLHRLLTAIVVDHRRMQERYDRLLQSLYETVSPEDAEARAVVIRERGYYHVAQPFHQRLERVEPDLTLSDVLGLLD